MPLVRYALAAAAACLLGGAAYAQTGADQSAPPPADQSAAQPADNSGAAAPPAADNTQPGIAATGAGTETSAVVNGQTVEVISSQPVPDTKANRAKYGQPLSRAGKRTKPIGN
jgi:hypothetical protein